MLIELVVENLAVIERVRVRFHQGLNLLTGETGSGKSIVVDALGLLFGGRASGEMVRSGADRARVSGVFEVPPSPELFEVLQRAGIETEEGELLIEREIQSSGKSRALVGNRPATAALLRDLAPFLGDIHGQHDQQQLFSAAVQRDMLDAFAGAVELTRGVSSCYKQWRALAAELEDLDKTSQEKLRLADLWTFQCKEIETVAPQLGEDAELENERRILGNVVRLQESAGAAYAALYDDAHSAVAQLGTAIKRLDEVARIDASILEVVASLKSASIGVDEAAHGLRHYVGTLEADPKRLDEVESRLAVIEKVKRKYGATIGEILAFLDQVKAGLATAENSTQRRQEIEKEIAQAAAAYESAASKLSAKRREAASRLSQRVERELAALAMEKTRVEIRVEPLGPGANVSDHGGWSEHGSDTIRILISPNPGEEPKPLEKIASGGEMSRVALALKTCTGERVSESAGESADRAAPLTLVFDEVDAGVGGSAAEAVGRRLKKLSRGSQVLCVTHLPQIAGFADHHYSVEKHTVKGRTIAAIEELTPEARTREIGRMLSGERVTPEALRHAEQLIKFAVE
jgi:DNA repair protein RecN (Recombination protein N)